MATKQNSNSLWSQDQVKLFAKQAIDDVGKGFWAHVSTDIRRAICDAQVVSVLAGNYDEARFSPANVRALRTAIYKLNGCVL